MEGPAGWLWAVLAVVVIVIAAFAAVVYYRSRERKNARGRKEEVKDKFL